MDGLATAEIERERLARRLQPTGDSRGTTSGETIVKTSRIGRHRVVIVGGGFAGLFASKRLRRADVKVTVVDLSNHHLFQPLLYQLATGILSEGDIAPAIRDVLRHQHNASVVLGEVVDVEIDTRRVTVDTIGVRSEIPYDSLIIATGASQSYFGHPEFAREAPGMKTIDDALELRGRMKVESDCTLPGLPDVFVVGDLMSLDDLPGIAQVAIQSGRHAAATIARRLGGDATPRPFRYRDRGTMATISRMRAIASVGRLRVTGFIAWLLWLGVHLLALTSFKNRVLVFFN